MDLSDPQGVVREGGAKAPNDRGNTTISYPPHDLPLWEVGQLDLRLSPVENNKPEQSDDCSGLLFL